MPARPPGPPPLGAPWGKPDEQESHGGWGGRLDRPSYRQRTGAFALAPTWGDELGSSELSIAERSAGQPREDDGTRWAAPPQVAARFGLKEAVPPAPAHADPELQGAEDRERQRLATNRIPDDAEA